MIDENTMIPVQVRLRGAPGGRIEKVKPNCITLYNAHMSGVDTLDQCIAYYPFTMKFVFYLYQIAMYNSFVLYKCKVENRSCKFRIDFIKNVVRTLRKLIFE